MKTKNTLPFLAVGAIFIASSLLLSFAPGVTRGWGLNYIACFDPWGIGLYYVCLLCFVLPPTNQYLVRQITAISRQSIIASLRKHRYLLFAALSIVAVGAFHLLKVKYAFLGDSVANPILLESERWAPQHRDEYLTMWTLRHLYVGLHALFDFTSIQTVQLVDDIAGSLFMFFALCTANLLGDTFLKKAAAFIIATLSCTILLQFCGYTETYALPVLFLQLYFFTSLLYLNGKISSVVPALVLLLGIGFHLMLVCLLPSLILMFYGKVLWKYPLFRSKKTIALLVLISLPILYLAIQKFALPMMLPLHSPEGYMTLFSIAHFKEFFNGQLLGGGIGFLVWLMLLVYGAVGKIKYNLTAWFFLIASLSFVGLIFVFDAYRGSGDWDICACAAVVFNLSNAYVLLGEGGRIEKWCKDIKYGILMLAGFSICHTSMWLLINSTDMSIKWLERALETDPARFYRDWSHDNEFILADILLANDRADAALKWCEKRFLEKHDDDPNASHYYALALTKLNRQDEARAILEENVKEFPLYMRSYAALITLYAEIPDYDALYDILVQLYQVYKKYPEEVTYWLPQDKLKVYFETLAELRQQRMSNSD
ncbi:hypothetical protein AGMMS4957_13950 [Bacteroidia bacterium]|nr:hypothetical protein AGMMS4957_13950 [Bacteroidia bacterium]